MNGCTGGFGRLPGGWAGAGARKSLAATLGSEFKKTRPAVIDGHWFNNRNDALSPSGAEFSDTWEWNGLQWSEANVQGSPGPRFGHAMAYDPKRRRVVLFGGGGDAQDEGTRFRNDLWKLGLMPLRVTVTSGPGDGMLEIHWSGEAPPYQLQSRAGLNAGDWQNEGSPTDGLSATVRTDEAVKFFRVVSLFGDSP